MHKTPHILSAHLFAVMQTKLRHQNIPPIDRNARMPSARSVWLPLSRTNDRDIPALIKTTNAEGYSTSQSLMAPLGPETLSREGAYATARPRLKTKKT